MITRRAKIRRNDSGAVSVEYVLILAIISVIVLGSVASVGGSVQGYLFSAHAGLVR